MPRPIRKPQAASRKPLYHPAFTLIELLVVVSIIVILLALLVGGLDKAMSAAEKTKCLAHQATQAKSCQAFSIDYQNLMPPATQNGQGIAHSYDLRTTDGAGGTNVGTPIGPVGAGVSGPVGVGVGVNGVGVNTGAGTRYPLGIGLLVATKRIASTKLGELIHCSFLDNSASGNVPGHCMDKIHGAGKGGSYWTDSTANADRIIGSYNYRATSYFKSGEGNIRANKVGSSFVLLTDTPDRRWRGNGRATPPVNYGHPDGYNRVFADGSGGYLVDKDNRLQALMTQDNMDGMVNNGADDEKVFKELAFDRK